MLSSMLPSALSSRLPRFPLLRHAVSMHGIKSRHSSANSDASTVDLQNSPSGSGSHTPEYTSAMILSSDRGGLSEQDMTAYFEGVSSDEYLPQLASTKARQIEGTTLAETKSGIKWKFASQGMPLVF